MIKGWPHIVTYFTISELVQANFFGWIYVKNQKDLLIIASLIVGDRNRFSKVASNFIIVILHIRCNVLKWTSAFLTLKLNFKIRLSDLFYFQIHQNIARQSNICNIQLLIFTILTLYSLCNCCLNIKFSAWSMKHTKNEILKL